jgi:hypothetical protein
MVNSETHFLVGEFLKHGLNMDQNARPYASSLKIGEVHILAFSILSFALVLKRGRWA